MQKTSEIQTISEVFRYPQPAFLRRILGQRIFPVGTRGCRSIVYPESFFEEVYRYLYDVNKGILSSDSRRNGTE
ncbi:hypothetical protein, partial [uncultured Duncaniella sp.]|uniref:hypothetical protein n=1 Tax=uncultured Duncaniella sp. TaxID=2768039 RepID=UPI0025A56832